MRRQFACLRHLGGCGAAAGEYCITRGGWATEACHAARRDQYLGRSASRLALGPRVGTRSQITPGERNAQLVRRLSGLATDLESAAAAIRAVLGQLNG